MTFAYLACVGPAPRVAWWSSAGRVDICAVAYGYVTETVAIDGSDGERAK